LSPRLLSKNLKIKVQKNTILPFVLYGCETWSLTLKEEQRLRVLENRVLQRMFAPNREKVAGGWKLHNVELRNLYASPNIDRVIKSRRMIWMGHVTLMGEMRNAWYSLVGKSAG
jgi:hypothetical protein